MNRTRKCELNITVLSLGLALLLSSFTKLTAQRKFEDSLHYLIERKLEKASLESESRRSVVKFLAYDKLSEKWMIINKKEGAANLKELNAVINDAQVIRLAKETAKQNFILPIYFMIVNDDVSFLRDKELIVSGDDLNDMLEILTKQNNQQIKKTVVLNPVRIIRYNRKQVE